MEPEPPGAASFPAPLLLVVSLATGFVSGLNAVVGGPFVVLAACVLCREIALVAVVLYAADTDRHPGPQQLLAPQRRQAVLPAAAAYVRFKHWLHVVIPSAAA